MSAGTQSPPLEATGEHKPMGISSVNNPDAKIEVVPDCDQRTRTSSISALRNCTSDLRSEYFQEPTTVAQKRAAGNQKVCRNQISSCYDRPLILVTHRGRWVRPSVPKWKGKVDPSIEYCIMYNT